MVPDTGEYEYPIKKLKDLGYYYVTGPGMTRNGRLIFDLFRGNRIRTTELLDTPLREDGNMVYYKFSYLYRHFEFLLFNK